MVVNPLHFDRLQKALSYSFVPAVPFLAHPLDNRGICLQDLCELVTSIHGTPVREKDQLLGNRSVPDRHMQSDVFQKN